MHLGLDDVDRAGASSWLALAVVHGAERGHRRIQQPLADRLALGVEHRIGGHQVPDIAHQQQRPPLERQRRAVGRRVGAIGIEPAGHRLAALLERVLERRPFISPSQLR